MNRQQLYVEVARLADTDGTKINMAEVSRVCSLLLDCLNKRLQESKTSDNLDHSEFVIQLINLIEEKDV